MHKPMHRNPLPACLFEKSIYIQKVKWLLEINPIPFSFAIQYRLTKHKQTALSRHVFIEKSQPIGDYSGQYRRPSLFSK